MINLVVCFLHIWNLKIVKGNSIPKIMPFQFLSTVQEGHRQQIICSIVAGDPPFVFTWRKDGKELSKYIEIKTDDLYSLLIIPSVRTEDIGNYTCLANNAIGTDSYTAALKMKGI
ncbi:neuronal growth regulator 1-like [Centruroides sculpturatus]|uniref:neuronal growth regulator 1-like n=1 Tax=Centruroides sculpturatus TaxID=218467 RepID=UPI000C6DA8B9|nr:neuronal growth regulator 1-like [Centruroides sculpturatus]